MACCEYKICSTEKNCYCLLSRMVMRGQYRLLAFWKSEIDNLKPCQSLAEASNTKMATLLALHHQLQFHESAWQNYTSSKTTNSCFWARSGTKRLSPNSTSSHSASLLFQALKRIIRIPTVQGQKVFASVFMSTYFELCEYFRRHQRLASMTSLIYLASCPLLDEGVDRYSEVGLRWCQSSYSLPLACLIWKNEYHSLRIAKSSDDQ